MDRFDEELRQERQGMAILRDGMCPDCLQATTWCVCWDKEDVEEFWSLQGAGRYAMEEEL